MDTDHDPALQSAAAERALAQLEVFLAEDPVNAGLRAEAFECAMRAGLRDVARRHLDAGRQVGGDPLAWTLREAHWLMSGHQWSAARDLLAGVLDAPAAPDGLRVAARLDFALATLQLGDPQSGLEALAPLVEGLPAGATPQPPVQAAWLRLLHHAGRPRDALAKAREWSAGGVLEAEALGIAALAALDAEGPLAGVAMAEAALAARPEQVEALTTLGSAWLARERPQVALTFLSRALAVRPGDGRIRSAQGFALMMGGALDDAVTAFARALEAMPLHVGTWHGLGWASLLRGHLVEAKRAFERAITLDRGFAESHGSIAVVLAMTGDRGAAARSIEVARRLDASCVSADYASAVLEGRAANRATIEALARRATAGSLARGRDGTVNT